MSTQDNKDVIRRALEAVNANNMAALEPLIAAGFVEHTLPPSMGGNDFEAVKQAFAAVRQAFPDMRVEIEELLAEGDRVVVRGPWRGTSQAEFLGHPPTGRLVVMSSIHIFRLENGKIAEHWANQDDLAFLQQLGALPPMGPPSG